MSILFYGLVFYYYYQFFTNPSFNICGPEFVGLVIVGIIANLRKRVNNDIR